MKHLYATNRWPHLKTYKKQMCLNGESSTGIPSLERLSVTVTFGPMGFKILKVPLFYHIWSCCGLELWSFIPLLMMFDLPCSTESLLSFVRKHYLRMIGYSCHRMRNRPIFLQCIPGLHCWTPLGTSIPQTPNCLLCFPAVLTALITVKSRIQYAHLYNTHPKLSQENRGKTSV